MGDRDDRGGGERGPLFAPSGERTVVVPERLRGPFEEAERTVAAYFSQFVSDPSRGLIEIGDQRYLLVRASALSTGFLDSIRRVYGDRDVEVAQTIAWDFLYDIAHSIGTDDARDFHQRMKVVDPIEKLSAGPVHFAFSGWALVDIKPESHAVPNENYVLTYDHPNSFEADSWIRAGRHSDRPVCIMSCGYSSGWCGESFGLSLTAVEVQCRARGDSQCTFVMAPPHRIEERIKELFEDSPTVSLEGLVIPNYFKRKHEEDQRSRFIERIIIAQDEERRRIARELHDELGSLLTSLGMGLRTVELTTSIEEAHTQAQELQQTAQICLESLRRLARGLHPSVLDDLGFVTALDRYIESYTLAHQIEVELEVRGFDETEIPHTLAIALYRVIQETLTNAARHGEASNISVVIARQGNLLTVVVEDDGRGFGSGPPQLDNPRGLGLQAINERVSLLKGTITFETTPGGGCTVVVQVPMPVVEGPRTKTENP